MYSGPVLIGAQKPRFRKIVEYRLFLYNKPELLLNIFKLNEGLFPAKKCDLADAIENIVKK